MARRTRGHDMRLAPIACAAWLGTLAGISSAANMPRWAAYVGAAGVAVALIALARGWLRSRPTLAMAAVIGAVFCGFGVHGVHLEDARHPEAIVSLARSGARVSLEGTVRSRPEEDAVGGTCRVDVAVSSLGVRGSVLYRAPSVDGLRALARELGIVPRASLYATVHTPECGLLIGQRIDAEGTVALPWKAREGIALELTAQEYEVKGAGAWAYRRVDAIGHALAQALTHFPAHAQGLVPGVALGDDSRMSGELVAAMKCVQLTHLTAVSGAHVSLVMGVALRALGRRHPRRAAGACAAVLGGLVVLVGPHSSVLRAGFMGGLICLGIALERSTHAMAALSAAVLGACILVPYTALSYGFLLSASATAGIVLLGRPLAYRLESRDAPSRAGHGNTGARSIVRETFALSLAAQLACIPTLMAFTDTSSVWGIAANALVAPVVAPLTICGLCAALCAPILPALATLALFPASACSAWIALIAQALATWPGSGISLASSAMFLIVLALAVWRWRWAAVFAYGVAGLACLAVSLLPTPSPAIAEDWDVVQCDVGQGSALLARRGGYTIMVDVGPAGDAGAECVRAAGVSSIDVLVLSHYHADHIGGLRGVMAEADIGALWVSPNTEPEDEAAHVRVLAEDAGVPMYVARAGDSLTFDGEAMMEVLNPGAELSGDANHDSLAVLLHIAGGVLVLGDADGDSQGAIATRLGRPVRTVIVAHHGSAHQSPRLVRIAQPEYALISVGENEYGHPTRQALEAYSTAQIYTTMECGPIVLADEALHSQCAEP